MVDHINEIKNMVISNSAREKKIFNSLKNMWILNLKEILYLKSKNKERTEVTS